jgi:hypothetical protein
MQRLGKRLQTNWNNYQKKAKECFSRNGLPAVAMTTNSIAV